MGVVVVLLGWCFLCVCVYVVGWVFYVVYERFGGEVVGDGDGEVG